MSSFAKIVKAWDFDDHAINMAIEKLHEQVLELAAKKIIDKSGYYHLDLKRMFGFHASCNAIQGQLVSILPDYTRCHETFEV